MAEKIKTEVVNTRSGWNGKKIVTEKVVEPPYTVYCSSSIPDCFSISMKVGGLRKMLEGLDDEDTFGVTLYSGYRATEYSIIRNSKK